MSEERIGKLEESLHAVRKLVREQDRDQREALAGLRHALLAATLGGATLALTAATWRTTTYREDIVEVNSLWGMASYGAPAVLALVLVLAAAVGSVWTFLAGGGPKPHLVLAGLALVTVVPILFVGTVENASPLWRAVDQTGAGRWLTLVALLVLAIVHTTRAVALRRAESA